MYAMNRLFVRNARKVFTKQTRYNGNTSSTPNYEVDDQVLGIYFAGIFCSGCAGSAISMYSAYKLSRHCDIAENIFNTTLGALSGGILGGFVGIFWPIVLPIGTGVTIMRQIT
jgi:hypothetical protein